MDIKCVNHRSISESTPHACCHLEFLSCDLATLSPWKCRSVRESQRNKNTRRVNMSMSSELYTSSRHRYRCGVDGCWREPVFSAPTQGRGYSYFGDYCEDHTCGIDGCPLPSDGDAPFCYEHGCWYAGCPLPSMAAAGGYDREFSPHPPFPPFSSPTILF